MAEWFEGSGEIDCTIEDVKDGIADPGQFFVGVVSRMPGLTSVELIEQTDDSVTIRTNAGLMKRTSISKTIETDRVVIELDEDYEAGSKVTAKSHFSDTFTSTHTGVRHSLVISDVSAPGFLGFFYQRFGSSKMGNAFLSSYKAYLETEQA